MEALAPARAEARIDHRRQPDDRSVAFNGEVSELVEGACLESM
jgi:hypothetical protein